MSGPGWGGFGETSEPRSRSVTPLRIELRDCWPGTPTASRPLVALGLGLILSLVIVGLSVSVWAFAFHTVSAAFSGTQSQTRIGDEVTLAGQQSLALQSRLVEQRRAAVAVYVARRAEFDTAKAGLVDQGSELRAAEARRRDAVLTGLVLECIDAVGTYNLAAQALPVTKLGLPGLPERFVWEVDCASGQ